MTLGHTSIPIADPPRPAMKHTGVETWGKALFGAVLLGWAASLVLGFRSGLALVTVAGFAAALTGLARPAVGLLGVGVLCTIDAPSRIYLFTGGLFRYNTYNYLLLSVALLSLPLLLRFRDVHTRLLAALVALLGLELLITPELAFGVQHVFNAVSTFGLLVYLERGGVRDETWVWLGLTSGVTAAAGGLSYFAQKVELLSSNANAMAYLPVGGLLMICLAFRFADAQPRRQLLLAIFAACNLVWVFLTGSRGALLVGLLCALYLLHSTPGFGRRAVVVGSMLLLTFGVATQYTGLQEFAVHRWEALVDPARSLSSRTSGRSDLVVGGLYIFQDHPFGVGTGGFASAWADLGRREGLSGFEEGVRFQAHAGWIKILAENGLPGILLLVAFVASFTIVGWRQRDRRWRLLGMLTTAVLSAAWVSTEFQAKSLWMLAAAAATLLRPRPRFAAVVRDDRDPPGRPQLRRPS